MKRSKSLFFGYLKNPKIGVFCILFALLLIASPIFAKTGEALTVSPSLPCGLKLSSNASFFASSKDSGSMHPLGIQMDYRKKDWIVETSTTYTKKTPVLEASSQGGISDLIYYVYVDSNPQLWMYFGGGTVMFWQLDGQSVRPLPLVALKYTSKLSSNFEIDVNLNGSYFLYGTFAQAEVSYGYRF